MASDKIKIIRAVYLYLVTAISIVILIIASIGLINVFLENYVFEVKEYYEFDKFYECEEGGQLATRKGPESVVAVPSEEGLIAVEEEEKVVMSPEEKTTCIAEAKVMREQQKWNNVKRELVDWISMIIIALPIYLIHWGIIKKEAKK